MENKYLLNMPWYNWSAWGGEFWFARLFVQRTMALIYLLVFISIARQIRPLVGENGLLPMNSYIETIGFWENPSIFQLFSTDRALAIGSWVGIALSLLALVGIPSKSGILMYMVIWGIMWLLYLSFVNIGQNFFENGYENLLCECGFLTIFLGPSSMLTPVVVIYLFRWVEFRNMFGSGLAKIRGDDCWMDLTCMKYHYETQPLPNQLAWLVYRLHNSVHRISVLTTHIVELAVPFLYFGPPRLAAIGGLITIIFHAWLIFTGNFAFLNILSISIAGSLFADSLVPYLNILPQTTSLELVPNWFQMVLITLVIIVIVLSYYPATNMVLKNWRIPAIANSIKIVNTYGAFGQIQRTRFELVIEGTHDRKITDDTTWQAYKFYKKPSNTKHLPRFLVPYPYRLDSQMWWMASQSPESPWPWFIEFIRKLLNENDNTVIPLLKKDPFNEAPKNIRVIMYEYRFTSFNEWMRSGNWWNREYIDVYLGPISLDDINKLQNTITE